MKNIYRFTDYRINHVHNRRSDLGGTMVSRQIVHLHNLRLQLDRRLRNTPKPIQKTKILSTSPQIHRWLRHKRQTTCNY